MPNKIQIKRTTTSGLLPNVSNSSNTSYIAAGELAINLTDRKLLSSNGSATFEVGANLASISVGGALTGNSTGLFVSSAAPQISLNNVTSNWITFSTNGVAAPTTTTRSAGTKLALYPSLNASQVDYAIGIESNHMWFSTDNATTGVKFYANTSNYMTANVAGLTVTGYANVSSTLAAGNTSITGFINVSSTAQFGSNVILGTTTISANGSVGTAGQILTSGGSGNVYWSTGGGGGSPGGANTQIQFNDGGSFGGDAGLTYNKTTDALTVAGALTVNGAVTVPNTAALGNTTVTGFANVTTTATIGTGFTLTSGNANFDSGVLFVDGTNNRVGVNNTTPAHALSVTGATNLGGAVTGITTLAAGNTTITGFANVTSTIQGGAGLTIAGAASGITTLAAGNTTITGFVNATSLAVSGNSVFQSNWTTRFQSGSDFVDGTLVSTDIPATASNGDSFIIEITGKSYDGSNPPFKVVAQGYLYNDTIISFSGINYGGSFSSYIRVFQDGGVLKFWWPRISYWNSFNVNVMGMDAPSNSTITRNRVTSITNSTEPTGTKKVTITLNQALRENSWINSKYFGSDGAIYGTIFHDSANSSFYVDPASTSNLSGLTVGTGFTLTSGNANFDSGVLFVDGTNNRVGIGNTTPGHALSVTGTTNLGGAVTGITTLAAGNTTITGTLSASNFSGSSSGTNTGDQTNISGNAGTATTLQTTRSINLVNFNGSANITIPRMNALDDRTIAPADGSAGYVTSFFTSWTNNNNSPYADALLFRTWADSSGGNDNLVTFRKDAIGMRIWQQASGSATAFSSFKDVAWTDGTNASGNWGINVTGSAGSVDFNNLTNKGSGTGTYTTSGDFRAPIFYDSNNTAFYTDPASTSVLNGLTVGGYGVVRTAGTINNNIDSDYGETYVTFDPVPSGTPPISSPNIRTINIGNNFARRTQLAFTYDTDRAWFRRRSDGGWGSWFEFAVFGNSASAGALYGTIYYDGNNTAFYVDPASTSLLNVLRIGSSESGLYLSSSRLVVRSESADNVAQFASYGMYLPVTGQTAGLYVESPIEARTGLRMGSSAANGTITVGADTAVTANRLVQRDGNGYIYANHINFNTSETENPTIGSFITSNGDGWSRKSSLAHVKNSIRGVADGSWGINITGNAATASGLTTRYDGGVLTNPQQYFSSSVGLRVAMTGVPVTWADTLWINGYSGGDVLSMCALHTSRQGTPRMWISTQQSTATSYGTTYEFPTLGYNSGNTNGLYAGLYYDSNNTGYYVDAASTTNLNALTLQGGIPTINGYSPSNGVIRMTPNLHLNSGAGNAVIVNWDNGTTGGSWTFRVGSGNGGGDVYYIRGDGYSYQTNYAENASSFRAPIFYDNADTAYFINANDNSNLNTLSMAGLITGRSSGSTDVNSANDTGSISIRGSTTTVAAMSFHRSGAYAINMGLGTDNVFRIGGWSASSNAFQMDGSGNLTMLNNVTAYSDARLKKDIVKIDNAIDKVQQLNGYTYTRTDTGSRQAGVIAQEVMKVLPEVVMGSEETNYSVAYGNMVGLLIEAIKEQQEQINRLEVKINSLQQGN